MTGVALDLCVPEAQREFCRLIMIEANRAPFILTVAALAFGAITAGVSIVNFVAIKTRGADILVALPNVAYGAVHVAMRALKRKLGPVVVERFDAVPRCFDVTIVADFPKTAFVRIFRLMTIETASWRVAKLCRFGMARTALNGLMCISQLEVRKRMIECFAVELNNVGGPPFVIGMTMRAFLLDCVRLPSVKALAGRPVRGSFFVTCEAQSSLRFS